jgi:hypothetical protein
VEVGSNQRVVVQERDPAVGEFEDVFAPGQARAQRLREDPDAGGAGPEKIFEWRGYLVYSKIDLVRIRRAQFANAYVTTHSQLEA